MSNVTDAATLRQIASNYTADDGGDWKETCERIANQLESDAKRFEESKQLQDIGRSAFESIAEMVAALECNYDRLEELREEEDALGLNVEERDLWIAENMEELAELEEAAGECESREEAEQRIQEDPLSIEMRGDWVAYGTEPIDAAKPVEFQILLGTGGPATRIMGEIDEHGEPCRAWIEAQDWFKPWTQYIGGDSETLLTYCRCFSFGEG